MSTDSNSPKPRRTTVEERRQVGRAAAAGLFATLVATLGLATLAIWHLIRRGRMLQSIAANSAKSTSNREPLIDPQISE